MQVECLPKCAEAHLPGEGGRPVLVFLLGGVRGHLCRFAPVWRRPGFADDNSNVGPLCRLSGWGCLRELCWSFCSSRLCQGPAAVQTSEHVGLPAGA